MVEIFKIVVRIIIPRWLSDDRIIVDHNGDDEDDDDDYDYYKNGDQTWLFCDNWSTHLGYLYGTRSLAI